MTDHDYDAHTNEADKALWRSLQWRKPFAGKVLVGANPGFMNLLYKAKLAVDEWRALNPGCNLNTQQYKEEVMKENEARTMDIEEGNARFKQAAQAIAAGFGPQDQTDQGVARRTALPRPNIVVRHNNVDGNGADRQNVAEYCTRFKFAPCSSYGPKEEKPDKWQAAIEAVPGVTSVASYERAGLYDLIVKKATAYGWDEIEPKVLVILELRHAVLSDPTTRVAEQIDVPGAWGALHDEVSEDWAAARKEVQDAYVSYGGQ